MTNRPETMKELCANLCEGFLKSSQLHPDRPALEVASSVLTYAALRKLAASIALTAAKKGTKSQPPLTAVFAYRSVTAYAGILGSLMLGGGYVPLNMTFPVDRTKLMLERSGCRTLIVDPVSAEQLPSVLNGAEPGMLVILPEMEVVSALQAAFPQHTILGKNDLEAGDIESVPPVTAETIAYLLFTSGSTGTPKGVMVSHRNVRHYVDFTVKRHGITEVDRCSQTFDNTFDLSAHDMFVTWNCGATLCCPSRKALINPGRFINDSKLSIWFSVPSTGVFMKKLGVLKPGMYPGLRLSLFCGEALPMEVAKSWAEAAPNSVVENIYGPTELTIACTAYRWDRNSSAEECELGVVPIGEPYDGMTELVADENLNEVPLGTSGELLMTGPQVALGYWQDSEKTSKAFVVPPGRKEIFYRTGDRVRRPGMGKPLIYLGRVDNQIKILGHRVEIGEIEAVIREESGIDGVVAVGWPLNSGGADGIEAFLQAETAATQEILARVTKRLPVYMVPRKLHLLPAFPLNANGKFDRKALIQRLEKTT